MTSFVLIEWNNAKERDRIIGCLENDMEFSVTTDVMKFVSKKYNVDVQERSTISTDIRMVISKREKPDEYVNGIPVDYVDKNGNLLSVVSPGKVKIEEIDDEAVQGTVEQPVVVGAVASTDIIDNAQSMKIVETGAVENVEQHVVDTSSSSIDKLIGTAQKPEDKIAAVVENTNVVVNSAEQEKVEETVVASPAVQNITKSNNVEHGSLTKEAENENVQVPAEAVESIDEGVKEKKLTCAGPQVTNVVEDAPELEEAKPDITSQSENIVSSFIEQLVEKKRDAYLKDDSKSVKKSEKVASDDDKSKKTHSDEKTKKVATEHETSTETGQSTDKVANKHKDTCREDSSKSVKNAEKPTTDDVDKSKSTHTGKKSKQAATVRDTSTITEKETTKAADKHKDSYSKDNSKSVTDVVKLVTDSSDKKKKTLTDENAKEVGSTGTEQSTGKDSDKHKEAHPKDNSISADRAEKPAKTDSDKTKKTPIDEKTKKVATGHNTNTKTKSADKAAEKHKDTHRKDNSKSVQSVDKPTTDDSDKRKKTQTVVKSSDKQGAATRADNLTGKAAHPKDGFQGTRKAVSDSVTAKMTDKKVGNVTNQSTKKPRTSADQIIKTRKEVGQKPEKQSKVVEKQGVDDAKQVETTVSVVKNKKTEDGDCLKRNDTPKPESSMKRPLEPTKLVSNGVVKEIEVKRAKLMEGSNEMDTPVVIKPLVVEKSVKTSEKVVSDDIDKSKKIHSDEKTKQAGISTDKVADKHKDAHRKDNSNSVKSVDNQPTDDADKSKKVRAVVKTENKQGTSTKIDKSTEKDAHHKNGSNEIRQAVGNSVTEKMTEKRVRNVENVNTQRTEKPRTSADQIIKTQKEFGQNFKEGLEIVEKQGVDDTKQVETTTSVVKIKQAENGDCVKRNDALKPQSPMKRSLESTKPVSKGVVKKVGTEAVADVDILGRILESTKWNDASEMLRRELQSSMKRPFGVTKSVAYEMIKKIRMKKPKLMEESSEMDTPVVIKPLVVEKSIESSELDTSVAVKSLGINAVVEKSVESSELDTTSDDEMETDKWHDKYDSRGRRYLKCQECHSYNNLSYVKGHLAVHIPPQEYVCPINMCTYKSVWDVLMYVHFDDSHPNVTCVLKKVEQITEKEYNALMEKCFPELKVRQTIQNTCQLCNQMMIKNSSTERRIHSIFHTKIILYKCNEPECQYEVNHPGEMKQHGRYKHTKNLFLGEVKIKLTDEQELEIASTMKKCFPE